MTLRRIHLIGIGGVGLSAIARVLLAQGDVVSGSDMSRSLTTDELAQLGARISIGHRAENLGDAQIVLVTSAAPADNPELQEARRRGLRIVKRNDFFPELTAGKKTIAVAGTHGKTTTTGMIAAILLKAGLDPTVIVGGTIPELNGNARAGRGEYFVVEADEYDHAFLGLRPYIAVVTSIEMDHPDIYRDVGQIEKAFQQFMSLVPPDGLIVGCGDQERVAEAMGEIGNTQVLRYGLDPSNDWRAVNLVPNSKGGSDFDAWLGDQYVGAFSLRIPGQHNVLNALAAIAVANHVGVSTESYRETLASFQGAVRRFQVKGEVNKVTVVDDYAHHPSEIRATLAAAKQRYAGRDIWAVFQPHTFSRTLTLLDEFAQAFGDASHVIVADIFAARELVNPGVSSRDLVERIALPKAKYIGRLEDIADYLLVNLKRNDVLVTLGAGDVYRVGELVLARLDRSGRN